MNDDEIQSVLNLKDFVHNIEIIVVEKKVDYIDAVLMYCEKTGLEIETAAKIIKNNAKMKARIKTDAEDQNYLPKTSKLPID
jgi:hypothetical protein